MSDKCHSINSCYRLMVFKITGKAGEIEPIQIEGPMRDENDSI
jgi:hypothetical protein